MRRMQAAVGGLIAVVGALLTLSLVSLDAVLWPRVPGPTVPAPATLQALLEEGAQERFSVHATLRTEAPGARILIDETRPDLLSPLHLRTLGAAGDIEHVAVPAIWIPDGPPDLEGALRRNGWELHRAPGPIETLIVGERDGRAVLVDVRAVPPSAGADNLLASGTGQSSRTIQPAPSLGRAIVLETAYLLVLMLLGGLALPRVVSDRLPRPALAMIAGAGLQSLGAYLFVLGRSALAVGGLVAVAVGLHLRRRGLRPGWSRGDLPGLAGAALVIGIVVGVVRRSGFVVIGASGVEHIARAIAMGRGELVLADLNEKRPLATAALQAPGHLLGIEGVHALGWVLLLAGLALLVALPRLLAASGVATNVFAVLLAAALFLNPMVRVMASIFEASLLVASGLLLLLVLWFRAPDPGPGDPLGVAPVAAIVLLALIPTRSESLVVVGLVLLATLVRNEGPMVWCWAWPIVGLGTAAWNVLHILAAWGQGDRASFPVIALTVLGIAIAALGPALARVPARPRAALPGVVMAALWLFVLAIALTPLGADALLFEGLAVNIGQGGGGWGAFAPILAAATLLALIAHLPSVGPRRTLAVWLALGAVPSVVIAKAADGPSGIDFDDPEAAVSSILGASARVGSWGDSANRMWVHFVLVLAALVIMALVPRDRDGEVTAARRGPVLRGGLRIAAIVGVLVVLAGWSPTYLGPDGPGTVRPIVQRTLDAGTVELVRGTVVEEEIRVATEPLPPDTTDVQVCAVFRFDDLGRVSWGAVSYGLIGPAGEEIRRFGPHPWSGLREEILCLDVRELRDGPVRLAARVTGGGAQGRAPGVAIDRDGNVVAELDVRYVAASEDPRPFVMQVVSRTLRIAMRAGPAVVTLMLAASLALMLQRPRADAPDGTVGRAATHG